MKRGHRTLDTDAPPLETSGRPAWEPDPGGDDPDAHLHDGYFQASHPDAAVPGRRPHWHRETDQEPVPWTTHPDWAATAPTTPPPPSPIPTPLGHPDGHRVVDALLGIPTLKEPPMPTDTRPPYDPVAMTGPHEGHVHAVPDPEAAARGRHPAGRALATTTDTRDARARGGVTLLTAALGAAVPPAQQEYALRLAAQQAEAAEVVRLIGRVWSTLTGQRELADPGDVADLYQAARALALSAGLDTDPDA